MASTMAHWFIEQILYCREIKDGNAISDTVYPADMLQFCYCFGCLRNKYSLLINESDLSTSFQFHLMIYDLIYIIWSKFNSN